jgi:hypothetical protein
VKDETATDIVNGALLLILGTAGIYSLYSSNLFNNTVEVFFTTLFGAAVFILVILGFWVIFYNAHVRKNAILQQPTGSDSIVAISAEALVENPENV